MEQFEDQEVQNNINGPLKSLAETARIAGIAAVVSLLGTLSGVMVFFSNPVPVAVTPKEGFDDTTPAIPAGASYISVWISVIVGLLAFYFLYRFFTFTKAFFKNNDRQKLVPALYSLSGYFKIWAVIMLVIICFFVLIFIGGVLGASFKG